MNEIILKTWKSTFSLILNDFWLDTFSVTDKTNPKAITWLESTLPESTGEFDADAEELGKLRDEVRILEGELNRESERNTELQKQIISSRSRSDEMVAMMQLLRSETEAVLERCVFIDLCSILLGLCARTDLYFYNIQAQSYHGDSWSSCQICWAS